MLKGEKGEDEDGGGDIAKEDSRPLRASDQISKRSQCLRTASASSGSRFSVGCAQAAPTQERTLNKVKSHLVTDFPLLKS